MFSFFPLDRLGIHMAASQGSFEDNLPCEATTFQEAMVSYIMQSFYLTFTF